MTDLVKQSPGNALTQAAEWSQHQLAVIREQIAPDITDPELAHFQQVCKHTGLSPFTSPPQMYAVMRYDKRLGRKKMVIQAGIDGIRLAAQRTGAYAGSDDIAYTYAEDGTVAAATATVYRIVQGVRCPFTATARMDEYRPAPPNDAMWKKMPHGQLGKCAEAKALRKGFPQELAGVYVTEEMHQADAAQVVAEPLTPAQADTLRALSIEAGISEAAVTARLRTMTQDRYEEAVAAVKQRIVEQGSVAPAEDVEASETVVEEPPCPVCDSSGEVDGAVCTDCHGSGLAS